MSRMSSMTSCPLNKVSENIFRKRLLDFLPGEWDVGPWDELELRVVDDVVDQALTLPVGQARQTSDQKQWG